MSRAVSVLRPPSPPDPPLDPDGDEGRSLLRRELADPDYYADDLLDRIVAWLLRRVDGAFGTARTLRR